MNAKTVSNSFLQNSFFQLLEKPPHVSVKTVLRYMGVFAKLTFFHWPFFSIRNFNLHNFKGNENAASFFYDVSMCFLLNQPKMVCGSFGWY